MSKRILLLLVLSLLALPAFAQKGEIDELGFKAEKVYDFTNIDSVNLFNGNLNISIPIGKRYKVGGALSYQLSLIFNGKIWDYETWTEYDGNGNPQERGRSYPNLRSNAGLGWRVVLARQKSWGLGADLGYELGTRVYDSKLPSDKFHHGRSDVSHTVDAGLRLTLRQISPEGGFGRGPVGNLPLLPALPAHAQPAIAGLDIIERKNAIFARWHSLELETTVLIRDGGNVERRQ